VHRPCGAGAKGGDDAVKVPLLDLKAQYKTIRDEVRAAVDEVMASQSFILGPQVAELESKVAAVCGVPAAVGCASGTDALYLSLRALDIGSGDEVVTVPYTFFATAGAIANVGARPVFVDIEPDTFNMNPEKIDRAITPRTKAIIPVHLFGQCADMPRIGAAAAMKKIPVIEDAAQAIGATCQGKKAGAMGTVGCFSFFPSKNLGGFGDGGMVVSTDTALAEKIRILRVHGSQPKYFHALVGVNSRLDTLQAAVLLAKLPHLDRWSEGRRGVAAFYDRAFADTPAIVRPVTRPGNTHIYNQYTIRVPDRDGLVKHLEAKGVGHALYYPLPLHLQRCFASLGYREGDFPESERAARETISLPVYPELSIEARTYVADTVRSYFR
jgi:dTDP-4-amino-4,6-dideoxygalactose transaminase